MAATATHDIARSSSFSSCGSEASPGSRNNSSSAMQLDDDDEEDGNNDEKDGQHKTSQAIPIQTKPPTSQQPQPQHRQVVSTSPASSNVNELVSKAKKAASSLWLILHSQNCQISNCHHRGCSETKTLLVHVHSCHTTNCLIKGCNETKKLLGHYTKCKSLRDINENHSCLVCSLMARYAKSMLEREGGEDVQCKLVVNSSGGSGEEQKQQAAQHNRQSSMTLMPPPPPRLATQQTPIKSCSTLPQHPSEVVQAEPMSSKLTALAKVAAVLSPNVPSVNTSYMRSTSLQLGKSYDSSVSTTSSPFSILKQGINGTTSVSRLEDEVMASISPDESSEQLVIPTGNNNRRRPRAESFDERKTRVKFAPGVTTAYFNAESPLPYAHYEQQPQLSSPNRPRSASCSSVGGNSTDSGNSTGNSSDGMGGNCETIVEEGVFVQQQKEQQAAEQPIFDMD